MKGSSTGRSPVSGRGLTALVAAVVVCACAAGAANNNTSQAASQAYVALVQADQARDREEWTPAVAGYRDALEQYQQLAKEHPDWEPDIVQYRITYCGNQIEALARKVDPSARKQLAAAPAPSAPDRPSEDEVYRERYLALLQENQYLRQRLAGMQDADVEDEMAASGLATENARLKAEIEDARRASAGAHDTAAEAQMIATLQERVVQLNRENQELMNAIRGAPAGAAGDAAAPLAFEESDTGIFGLMRAGLAQERQGNFTAALYIYERAAAARPSFPEAVKAKARCLLGLDRAAEAARLLEELLSTEPANLRAQLLLGIAYGRMARFRKAADILQTVVRDDPPNAAAHNALGAAWLAMGETKAALPELERAVSLDPESSDAHFNLAQAYAMTRPPDREKARTHYRRAVELGGKEDPAVEQLLESR